jgi:hypothetical protein
LEWCTDTCHLQQQADLFEEEKAKKGKLGFRKKPEELSEQQIETRITSQE